MDPFRYSENPGDYLPLENKILEAVLALTYFLAEHGIGVSIYAYSEKLLKFRVGGTEDFEEFYNAMSGFSFRKSNTHKEFFAACDSDETITDCSSVIYILHEWSDAARLYSERLSGYSIRQNLYLVTDRSEGFKAGADDHLGYKVIGYEDRISEVLG